MNKNEIISKVKFSLLEKYDASGMDDEFINDCIDKTLEAINYTHCCTELRDEYLQPELEKYKKIKVVRTNGKSDM